MLLGAILFIGLGLMALFMFLSSIIGFVRPQGFFKGFTLVQHPIALLKIDNILQSGPRMDFWMESLKTLGKDRSVKGIILRIDSPGGSVGASQELYDEILNVRRKHGKKVYVSMGDVAASGGYYIASAADRIYANRGTMTGSIGVISTYYRAEGLAEKLGVDVRVVKKGRFKDAGSMFREMTEDEEKIFDLLLSSAYEQFIDDILDQRETELAGALSNFSDPDWDRFLFERPRAVTARNFLYQIADGRVYSGAHALQLGLVDELGALNHVIGEMAAELGVPEKATIREPRERLSFFDLLSMKVKAATPDFWGHQTLQYRMISF